MNIIFEDVKNEVIFASEKFPPYHSLHEGYAIMLEEFNELWDEIKQKERDLTSIYSETKQVACTAIRFMILVKELQDKADFVGDISGPAAEITDKDFQQCLECFFLEDCAGQCFEKLNNPQDIEFTDEISDIGGE